MMGLEQFLICIVGNLLNLCICGGVPFEYLYDVARLKFYIKSIPECSFVFNFNHVFLSEHNVVRHFAKYGIHNMSDTQYNFVNIIQLKFYELVLDKYL